MSEKWKRTGDPSRDMGDLVQSHTKGEITGETYEKRFGVLDAEMQKGRGISERTSRRDQEWRGEMI